MSATLPGVFDAAAILIALAAVLGYVVRS